MNTPAPFASSRESEIHTKPAKRPGAIAKPRLIKPPAPLQRQGSISQAVSRARRRKMDACLRRQAVWQKETAWPW